MEAATAHRCPWFDVIRGLASLAVCISHLRNTTLQDSSSAGIAFAPFYFVTGLGHPAVIVFFVLSGFFVGGSVIRTSKAFSLKNYAVTRVTRLWIVVIPACVFTLYCDHISARSLPDVFTGRYWSIIHSGPEMHTYSASIRTGILNVLFLQTIAAPVFGSNGPMWSLANEFWYYALWPIIWMAIFNKISVVSKKERAALLICALLIIWLLPRSFYVGGIIWTLGCVVYILVTQYGIHGMHSWLRWATVVIFVTALILEKVPSSRYFGPGEADLVLGLAVGSILIWLYKHPFPADSIFCRTTLFLSKISFSLYVVHFPLVMLLFSLFYSGQRKTMSLSSISVLTFELCGLIACGFVFWWLFEQHTSKMREKVFVLFSAFSQSNNLKRNNL